MHSTDRTLVPEPGMLAEAAHRGAVADADADADPDPNMEGVRLLELELLADMSDYEATLHKHSAG